MRKTGWWTMWAGAVLCLVCVAGGIVVAVGGFTHIGADAKHDVRFDSDTTISLKAGQRIAVYVRRSDASGSDGSGGVSTSRTWLPAECTVGAPDGTTREFEADGSSTVTRGRESWQSSGVFTAPTDGIYSVSCSDAQKHFLNGPVSLGGIFAGVGGILAAVFGGLLTIAVFVLGLVLWIVGRGRETGRATQRDAGAQ